MKRLTAIALTVLLLLGISLTSHASSVREQTLKDNSKASTRSVASVETIGYLADADGDVIINRGDGDEGVSTLAPGETVYFKLKTPYNLAVTNEAAVSGVTFTPSWTVGGEHISKIEIVWKKFIDVNEEDYCYMLAVTAKANDSLASNKDAMGNVILKKTSGTDSLADSGSNSLVFTLDIRFFFTIGYEADEFTTIPKTPMIYSKESGTTGSIDFDFEDCDFATFTVDVGGQGKIALGANSTPIQSIENSYPSAHLTFFNGNGGSFNKMGTLKLMAADGSHLYVIGSGNKLTASDALYDAYEGAFLIETRTLGRYVIADRVLGTANSTSSTGDFGSSSSNPLEHVASDTVSVTEPPSYTTSGGKVNPGTGAAA